MFFPRCPQAVRPLSSCLGWQLRRDIPIRVSGQMGTGTGVANIVWDMEEMDMGVPSGGGKLSELLESSHGWLVVFKTSGDAGLR